MSDKPESTEEHILPEDEGSQAVPAEDAEQGQEDSDLAATNEVLQQELAEAKDTVLRVQAEMQNMRRRVERDIENAHKFALERFVGELLEVVDNLERALAAFDVSDKEQTPLIEGVELTLKSFLGVLERFQVESVNPKGDTFNPELHQAMSTVPSAEVAPNTVVEVFQKGYQLNGRLVRPAMVVVSKAP